MDYTQMGQASNATGNGAFFTAGAGVDSTDENSFEAENNLDLTNSPWGNTPERDNRSIGSSVLSVPGDTAPQAAPDESNRFNENVALSMPPGVEIETIVEKKETNQPTNIGRNDLLTGDKLSSKGIELIKNEERKLSQDGDIANFYDFITQARENIQFGEDAA